MLKFFKTDSPPMTKAGKPKKYYRTCSWKPIPESLRRKLFGDQKGRCAAPWCRKDKTYPEFEGDHIIPIDRGGTNRDNNYQLLCKECNTQKGNKLMSEWRDWRFRRCLSVEQR